MSKESSTQSDMLLRFHHIDEDEGLYQSYFKVYTNLNSLESCKEFEDETPLYLEIARDDSYVNDGEGFSLTIEQTKELIDVLQEAVDYLESE